MGRGDLGANSDLVSRLIAVKQKTAEVVLIHHHHFEQHRAIVKYTTCKLIATLSTRHFCPTRAGASKEATHYAYAGSLITRCCRGILARDGVMSLAKSVQYMEATDI